MRRPTTSSKATRVSKSTFISSSAATSIQICCPAASRTPRCVTFSSSMGRLRESPHAVLCRMSESIALGTDELIFERQDAVAWLIFNRPASRNAMTWAMYEGLFRACELVDADAGLRAFVLRGAGDKAFVAGTDIAQFQAFSTAADALNYERNVNRYASRLEAVQKPTIAMIRGYCVGGGAAIAMACD